MCTEEFIRMMFTVDFKLYGNRGLDSRKRYVAFQKTLLQSVPFPGSKMHFDPPPALSHGLFY